MSPVVSPVVSRAWLTRLLPDFAPARGNPAFRGCWPAGCCPPSAAR